MVEEVDRFFARDERYHEGEVYIIVVSRPLRLEQPGLGGGTASRQGPGVLYHTSDGRPVDPLDHHGCYRIRGEDTILTRFDPRASGYVAHWQEGRQPVSQ